MDGIIFDMDGVLCDSEPLIRQAAQAMFSERYGITVPDEDFRPFVGMGEDRFLGGPGERHGVQVRLPDDKDRTYAIYADLAPGRLTALPGVHQILTRARAAGLCLAVASAADLVKVQVNLLAIGVDPRGFQTLVTGSDVQRKKPDPEAFLLAAQRLGLPPSRCVVVEDAINGVRAAVAAGSPCLALTTSFPAADLLAAGAVAAIPHLGACDAAVLALLGLPTPIA